MEKSDGTCTIRRTARLTTGQAEAAKWHRRQIARVEDGSVSNLAGDEDHEDSVDGAADSSCTNRL